MKLLDKYIFKRVLSTFIFVVLILLAVITIIDLTEKIDKFSKANLSSIVILKYYLDYIPWLASLVTPITIFIATVYVAARMAGHSEIIAMLSSGMSFRRMLVPYFGAAAIIAVVSFVLNGWVIPNATKDRLEFELQYLKTKFYFDQKNIHMQLAPEVIMYMQSYSNANQSGYNFTMERFKGTRLIEKLSAKSLSWDSTKQKWKMRDWSLRRIDTVFTRKQFPVIPEENIALAGEVVANGLEKDTTLEIHPKEFESDYRKYDGLTLNELDEYITRLKTRGSTGVEFYIVEKYTRYAAPFTIFILVFMGAIVASRKSRGGTGLQIALGFVLSFVFILFFMLFRTFAENGALPPIISVWIPNIIFTVISFFMYKFVPR